MNFDYKTKICDIPEKVECFPGSLNPKTTDKPTLGTTMISQLNSTCRSSDGLFGLPGDCTKYKECLDGQFQVKTCGDDLYFDQINQKCTNTKANCISSKKMTFCYALKTSN